MNKKSEKIKVQMMNNFTKLKTKFIELSTANKVTQVDWVNYSAQYNSFWNDSSK